MSALDRPTLEQSQLVLNAAREMLSAICSGKKRFSMSVPVQADDPDIVIGNALFIGEKLLQEFNKLRDTQNILDENPGLQSVLEERTFQDQKWGEQNHDPFTYITILTEEVGEMSQAALHTKFGGKHGGIEHLREEAVQTAAVALAIVECLDRGKWSW